MIFRASPFGPRASPIGPALLRSGLARPILIPIWSPHSLETLTFVLYSSLNFKHDGVERIPAQPSSGSGEIYLVTAFAAIVDKDRLRSLWSFSDVPRVQVQSTTLLLSFYNNSSSIAWVLEFMELKFSREWWQRLLGRAMVLWWSLIQFTHFFLHKSNTRWYHY